MTRSEEILSLKQQRQKLLDKKILLEEKLIIILNDMIN